MIIRYALFEGTIHAGREAEFQAFVRQRLVPLWSQFPKALDVRVTFGVQRDEGAPPLAMILATRYPDISAVDEALKSPVRFQSREVTGELLKMFDGRVHHHLMDLAYDTVATP